MAQLRQDFQKFVDSNAVIVVIGPESAQAFQDYFSKNDLPFIGIPDPSHQVLKQLGQKVNIFKLGRMPGQLIIDKYANVRYIHYGHDMADIPANQEILDLLAELNQEILT